MGRGFEAPPNPSAKDVEKHDPVKLLLDKHKKLKLDNTQIAGRANMMANRQLLYETLTQIRSNNKTARDSAIVMLEEPQKKKAYDMLEKQLEDNDKLMRGPGREGMGGGSRPPSGM